jgi:hypothetical protein
MPMKGAAAMELALELYRKPARARSLGRRDVPEGMLELIRIAAASDEEADALIPDEAKAKQPVREAAVFFLQQLLMQAEGDDFRQLGLKRSATLQDVKDHKRQLLKWLHPDRNKNAWEHVLFQRVSGAAERLEAAMRQGGAHPFPSERRKSRRRPAAAWKLTQKRTKHAADWRPRVKKLAIALAVFVAVVGTAQAVLSYTHGSEPTASIANFGLAD